MKRKSEAREFMNENMLNLAGLLKQEGKGRFSPQINHTLKFLSSILFTD